MQGGFNHRVTWNIEPMQDIPEGYTGGVQGRNSGGKHGLMEAMQGHILVQGELVGLYGKKK